MVAIPKTQQAVQLIGPDKLALNTSKTVVSPGPHQILCRVEAVGLCFSDLKLLKQFSSHARKSQVVSGIDPKILDQISSYAPGELPTVPGHEAVVRVAAVGVGVTAFKAGQRFLVQTDYRWLPTASSNAAFGYNFEGALQEYVLLDDRVFTSPEGDSMMIPASDNCSASAIALVEPWACVEDSYAAKNRTTLKAGGRMLIVAEQNIAAESVKVMFKKYGTPSQITVIGQLSGDLGIKTEQAENVAALKDAFYEDVIYFGTNPAVLEPLFWKVAPHGLINIVQCGKRFGKPVVTTVGRVHYGGIRIIGTTGSDPAAAMTTIPASGEIRKGDKINVIGAGGPMGVMHVIRNICQGVSGITVFAGDLDDARLGGLTKIAEPLAKKNNVTYRPVNPSKETVADKFNYIALMAPVPALVAASVKTAAECGIINIFAGIPAQVTAEIDLDTYIERKLFFIGTSGSVLDDMKLVLAKVESHKLDTNLSVAAVSGLDGSVDGIRAVEKALIPGKILVYPQCKGLGLTPINQLTGKLKPVADCLENGVWTKKAEEKLLQLFA